MKKVKLFLERREYFSSADLTNLDIDFINSHNNKAIDKELKGRIFMKSRYNDKSKLINWSYYRVLGVKSGDFKELGFNAPGTVILVDIINADRTGNYTIEKNTYIDEEVFLKDGNLTKWKEVSKSKWNSYIKKLIAYE